MSPETVSALVAAAVGQQFDTWAAEHPSLAAVIDRIRLTDHAVESLRQTPAYRRPSRPTTATGTNWSS